MSHSTPENTQGRNTGWHCTGELAKTTVGFAHNLNARSLSMEKIDELEVIITDFNVSIACVTETWFKQYIDDDRIVIGGFNCERKDRLNKRAGGVVCYLRNSMVYTRMVELEDQTLEVLWLKIMPKRLPR